MDTQKLTIEEELKKAKDELRKIHQGNTSQEVIDAIIEKIKEDTIEEGQVAKPAKSNEVHINS